MNNILRHINYGYDDIEAVIIAMTSLSKNFIMIGNHGTGKTKLAKFLSQGFNDSDSEGFVFYDATKDDLISIAGIPSPEGIKEGRLDFVKHKRSIWDKSTIVVDEITRASKENQNLWLEILEERTCFGIPLVYRSLIATANPDSYASANQLDEALLDRFYAIVPVPELQTNLRSGDVSEIVRLNLNEHANNRVELETKIKDELKSLFRNIQKEYDAYYNEPAVLEAVEKYAGQFISQLLIENSKTEDKIYISPRSYAKHFPDAIIVLASYFKSIGEDKPLIRGAEQSLTYCIATKFGIDKAILMQIHNNYKPILNQLHKAGSIELLRGEIAQLRTIKEKIRFLAENIERIQKTLKNDEVEYFLGSIIKEAEAHKYALIDLHRVTSKLSDEFANQKDYIKGTLILNFHKAIGNLIAYTDSDTWTYEAQTVKNNIRKIRTLARNNALLNSKDENIIKVNKFLLSLDYSKDKEARQSIIKFMNSIKL
jgi:MoxR-like ATPase